MEQPASELHMLTDISIPSSFVIDSATISNASQPTAQAAPLHPYNTQPNT